MQTIVEMNDVERMMTVKVGMIGHGGLLRVFFFTRPLRGSGYVWGIYPDGHRLWFHYTKHSSASLGTDIPQSNNR